MQIESHACSYRHEASRLEWSLYVRCWQSPHALGAPFIQLIPKPIA